MSWLTAPFAGLAGLPGLALGIILCAALLLAALGATWRAQVPGGITDRERRAQDPRWRRSARWSGRLLLLAPWLVVGSAVLFIVPIRRPETVVLISRSRLAPPYLPGEDPWEAATQKLRAGLGSNQSVLDAGAVAGAVLEQLRLDPPNGGWSAGTLATDRRVEDALRKVLIDEDMALPRIRAAALQPPPPVSGDLPPWLVESVEISVLRAMTRRYNVEHIEALVADRKSGVGWVWGGVETFLQHAGDGGSGVKEVRLTPVKDQPPFVLQGVLSARRSIGDCSSGLKLAIALTAASSEQFDPPLPSAKLTLSLYQGKQLLSGPYSETVPLGGESRFLRLEHCFGLPEIPLEKLEVRTGEPVQSVPVATADPGRRTHRQLRQVRVIAEESQISSWQAAFKAIREPDPERAGRIVATWQRRMATLGLDLLGKQGGELLSYSIRSCNAQSDGEGSEVTLDACRAHGIWIYPSTFPPEKLPAVERLSRQISVLRLRTLPRGLPGSDAWDGLSLAHGDLWRPQDPGFLPLVEAQPLSADLLSGSTPPTDLGLPLVTRQEIRSASGGLAIVTFLGFDPEEQGLFPPQEAGQAGFEPERFLAGWTQILETLYAAAEPPWTSSSTPGSQDHPRCFLTGADLARISGRGLWMPFVVLSLGVLLHALTVSLGVLSISRLSKQ